MVGKDATRDGEMADNIVAFQYNILFVESPVLDKWYGSWITSAEEITFYPSYVSLSICLSVSNLAWNYWLDHRENFSRDVDGKNWLNVGSRPRLAPNPRTSWRILQHCDLGIFSQLSALEVRLRRGAIQIHVYLYLYLTSLENRSDLRQNFITDISSDKEVCVSYGIHSAPDSGYEVTNSGSGPDLSWRIQRCLNALVGWSNDGMLPWDFVTGRLSTILFVVCWRPRLHTADMAMPRLCKTRTRPEAI